MESNPMILHCTDIHKTYALEGKSVSRLEVLRGIDLQIAAGELITIVGASGSGKSTLLHILGGLDRPTQGKVFWNDHDLSQMNDESLASLRGSHVGFVFQFHHLLPEFTAMENVMIPLMIRGGRPQDAGRTAKDVLHRLDYLPGSTTNRESFRAENNNALQWHGLSPIIRVSSLPTNRQEISIPQTVSNCMSWS